jgi:hypothetical protein
MHPLYDFTFCCQKSGLTKKVIFNPISSTACKLEILVRAHTYSLLGKNKHNYAYR